MILHDRRTAFSDLKRYNPELKRVEFWNEYYEWWQESAHKTVSSARLFAPIVSYESTWAEPYAEIFDK